MKVSVNIMCEHIENCYREYLYTVILPHLYRITNATEYRYEYTNALLRSHTWLFDLIKTVTDDIELQMSLYYQFSIRMF